MDELKGPKTTPYTFKEAYEAIKKNNPGCTLADAMKEAVKRYPHLHETFLKLGGWEDEKAAERKRVADRVLSHVSDAKKAGLPLETYLKNQGILK